MNRTKAAQLINGEIGRLPEGFHRSLSKGFLALVAILRLHDFAVLRADEDKSFLGQGDDLWTQLKCPSVWIYAKSSLQYKQELETLRSRDADNQVVHLQAQALRGNLEEQARLLELLKEFYDDREPNSFYSRLIVETHDESGESYLVPQGANIRMISDKGVQQKLHKEFHSEMLAFGEFLMSKL